MITQWAAHRLLVLAGMLLVADFACHPEPVPQNPQAACAEACQNGAGACETFAEDVCLTKCPDLSAEFVARLAAARSCTDVRGADPGAR